MTLADASSAEQTNSGFALVFVLLSLLVITSVITPFILAVRTDFMLASGSYLRSKQNHLAFGLTSVFAQRLFAAGSNSHHIVPPRSVPVQTVCGNQIINLQVQDQFGVIDLNTASKELLMHGLKALGFGDPEAARLAALIEQFRNPFVHSSIAGSDGLTNGLKHAPFEAIEELYEFPGFAKMPLGQLTEVFTVHSQRATLSAQSMSIALAKYLPDGPTPQYPFIVHDTGPASRYRIEVKVQSIRDAATGFAGQIVESSNGNKGKVILRERVTDPSYMERPAVPEIREMDCSEVFGEAIAARLELL